MLHLPLIHPRRDLVLLPMNYRSNSQIDQQRLLALRLRGARAVRVIARVLRVGGRHLREAGERHGRLLQLLELRLRVRRGKCVRTR